MAIMRRKQEKEKTKLGRRSVQKDISFMGVEGVEIGGVDDDVVESTWAPSAGLAGRLAEEDPIHCTIPDVPRRKPPIWKKPELRRLLEAVELLEE